MARAVAGESGVPFFSINGSEFIELFVGVGASRVRELFDEAKKAAPAIIFIDEIDAVGRVRGTGLGGGNDEREQTLNQLLSEMDGFTRSDLTIVLAATNRPDVLDPALLAPGQVRPARRHRASRFERAARHPRGAHHGQAARIPTSNLGRHRFEHAGVLRRGSREPRQRSGAQRNAQGRRLHRRQRFQRRVRQGRARRSARSAPHGRREAAASPSTSPATPSSPTSRPTPSHLRRVTILPRGMALGLTQQNLVEDRHLATQPELEAKLCVLLGGYAAEELIFQSLSSGSENDLKQATDLAYKMVAHYGMSEEVGPVYHEHHTEHPFLGQQLATDGGVSDATIHAIENEARRILGRSLEHAKRRITENRDTLDRLVDVLLEQESN